MNDHIKSEISSYLAGVLPESRNRQIESHAAACEKCRSALSKARAKQARIKREALKKASAEPVPNLFLARQGKAFGEASPSTGTPKLIPVLVVLGIAGIWIYRAYGPAVHTPVEITKAPVVPPPAVPELAPPPKKPAAPKPAPVTPVAPVAAAKPAEPPKPPIVLTVLQEWRGMDSGIKEGRLVVIRNAEAWKKLLAEVQSRDPLPDVDFAQKLVIGVFVGPKPIGTTIALGKIEEMDDAMYAPYMITGGAVQISTAAAATAPAAPAALSHPYLLAVIPRVEKRIRLSLKEN